jgi:DNA polymerase-3 subunit alpha
VLDRAIQGGAAVHADRRSGQRGLFEDADEHDAGEVVAQLPGVPEWPERERLLTEKEVLGFYLSSHPLAEHEQQLATYCTHSTTDISSLAVRTEVIVGGMLSAIRTNHTRSARAGQSDTKYAMFDLEDRDGAIRCILWPDGFVRYGHLVTGDAILVARGTVDKRPGSDEANLIVDELIPLDELDGRFTRGVIIRVLEEEHAEQGLEKLYEILRGYPGSCELRLLLCLTDGTRVCCTCDGVHVRLEPEMRRRIDALLGPGNFRLITENGSGSDRPSGSIGGRRPTGSSSRAVGAGSH